MRKTLENSKQLSTHRALGIAPIVILLVMDLVYSIEISVSPVNTAQDTDHVVTDNGWIYTWYQLVREWDGARVGLFSTMKTTPGGYSLFKVFDVEGNLVGSQTKLDASSSLTFKDPMMLFTSSSSTSEKILYSIQKTGGVYTFTQFYYYFAGSVGTCSMNDTFSSVYIVVYNAAAIWKYDTYISSDTKFTLLSDSNPITGTEGIDSQTGNIWIFKRSNGCLLVDRTTLGPLLTLSYNSYSFATCTIDNLNNSNVYCGDITIPTIWNFEISTSGSQIIVKSNVDISVYGINSNLVNMGVYQYITIIPGLNLSPLFVVISKLTNNLQAISIASLSSYVGTATLSGFHVVDYAKQRFCLVERSMNRIQIYELIIDNCTHRYDTMVCYKCTADNYYYDTSANNTCVSRDYFPPQYGIDTSTNERLKQCDTGCLKCTEDYTKCTTCGSSANYVLSKGKCRLKMELLTSVYRSRFRTAQFTFERLIDQRIDFESFRFEVYDESEDITTELKYDTDFIVLATTKGFIIHFNEELGIYDATLLITKKNTSNEDVISEDGSFVFSNYPIQLKHVFAISSNSIIGTASKYSQVAIASTSSVSIMIGMGSGGSASVLLLKAASNFFVLYLLAGPILIYPEMILKSAITIGIFPFLLKSPLESFSTDHSCIVNEYLSSRDIECNLITNYGLDTIAIYGILFLNIMVTIFVYLYIRRLIKRDHQVKKEVDHINRRVLSLIFISTTNTSSDGQQKEEEEERKILFEKENVQDKKTGNFKKYLFLVNFNRGYGVRLLFRLLNGVQPELMCYSMVNILQFRTFEFPMIVGLLLSIKAILYYFMMEVARLDLSMKIWSLCRTYSSIVPDSPLRIIQTSDPKEQELTKMRLSSILRIERLDHLLDSSFESLYFPSHLWQVLTPTILSVKNTLMVTVLLSLSLYPFVQISLALTIELLYFIASIKLKANSIKVERIIELYISCSNIVYMILKIVSLTGLSTHTRQSIIGLNAAFILISVSVLCTVYVVYTIIVSIKDMMCRCMHSDDKKKSKVHPTDISESRKKGVGRMDAQSNNSVHKGFTMKRKKNGHPKVVMDIRIGEEPQRETGIRKEKDEFRDE